MSGFKTVLKSHSQLQAKLSNKAEKCFILLVRTGLMSCIIEFPCSYNNESHISPIIGKQYLKYSWGNQKEMELNWLYR